MYIRQSRYMKGSGFGSFLRKVASKSIQKLKSPAVRNIVKKALKSPIVKSVVQQGAEKVLNSIASTKKVQKVLQSDPIQAIVNSPEIKKVFQGISTSKKRTKKNSTKKGYAKSKKRVPKSQLNDINLLLTKTNKKRKGWRQIQSGKGIILG